MNICFETASHQQPGAHISPRCLSRCKYIFIYAIRIISPSRTHLKFTRVCAVVSETHSKLFGGKIERPGTTYVCNISAFHWIGIDAMPPRAIEHQIPSHIPLIHFFFFHACLWVPGLHAEQKSICHLGLSYSPSPTRPPAIIVSQPLLAEKGSPEWQSIFL